MKVKIILLGFHFEEFELLAILWIWAWKGRCWITNLRRCGCVWFWWVW